MSQVYLTTPEHFDIFQMEARRWIERFGLKEWRIYIAHEKTCREAMYAECQWRSNSRQARIVLGLEWDKEPTEEELRLNAFHEVAELVLEPLASPLLDYLSDGEVDRRTHRLVRLLENVLWAPERQEKSNGEKLQDLYRTMAESVPHAFIRRSCDHDSP